jgi:hypothetical protein
MPYLRTPQTFLSIHSVGTAAYGVEDGKQNIEERVSMAKLPL